MDTLMGRTELVLCLTALLLALGCAPRKYQRVQVVNLHLHNNAGEVPIADVYLTIRSDRVVYVGDCGDLKRVKTVPKEWTPGNNIEVSFKKSRFYVRNSSGKDFACDVMGQTTAR
jgi:hypothetical protein